jgi:hypothetical protein
MLLIPRASRDDHPHRFSGRRRPDPARSRHQPRPPNILEGYRQFGIYAGRVLKGSKPGDLLVVQATKFETRHQQHNRPHVGPDRAAIAAR